MKEGASLLTGLKVSEVNDNRLQWTLNSKTARFEDGETRIHFIDPAIQLFEDETLTSDIKADTGFLNMDTKEAQLQKNVKVVSKTDGMILVTSRLFFSSARNKIWTDEPVTIYKDNTVTRGQGFTANPDLSLIEITKQETVTTGAKGAK